MTGLAENFNELDLAQYLDRFLEQGFDTWDTILDITESDFEILGVKLGHRRKLQRKIATSRGTSHAQALASAKLSSSSLGDKLLEEGTGVTASRSDGTDGGSSMQPSGKRKYRKHPKPDQHAPAMPRSAYVMFSNKTRENPKLKSLSFTEVAKLVGKNWQHLTTTEKEPYERQAFDAKEKYTIELGEYMTTETYKSYSEYLLDFKAKQLHTQESNQQPPNETSKVPKLQDTRTPAGRPGTTCNTVIGANAQTLAWSSQVRPKDIPTPEQSQQNRKNLRLPGILNGLDTAPGVGVGQTLHNQPRSVGAFSTPSLTSKLTPSNLQSTLSTESGETQSQRSSAAYFTPQKPLEQSCDRLFLPIPENFPGAKASAVLGFHKASTRILALDYSSISQASQWSGYYSSPRNAHPYQPASLQQPTMDDGLTSLDPISALLRADEIFSSEGRLAHRQHQPEEYMVESTNDCEEILRQLP